MTILRALSCAVLLAGTLPSFGQPPAEAPARLVPEAARPEDEKAIRNLFDQFADAWNAAASDRLSALFVAERGRVRSHEESFDGRERVRGFFAQALAERFRGSRLSIVSTEPRFRGPREASVIVTYELAPSSGPTLRNRFEALVSAGAEGGQWGLLRFWSYSFDADNPRPRMPAEPGLPAALPSMLQAVRVGGSIREPKKVFDVKPKYPDEAKQALVQGVVVMECTIGPTGEVVNVRVLRGIHLLDQAAIDSVSQWRYEPTLVNGQPVSVIMTVTVNFRLG